jgi:1-acyl-sn-glycerol-3-phosphate acyltransferase
VLLFVSRLPRLLLALAVNYLAFVALRLKNPGGVSPRDRARWMHCSCRRVARALHLSLSIDGSIPIHGLIVSNHLGYLDILAFASASPCIFVSKQDVLAWPIFGTLARCGGTIFVNRNQRTAVDSASRHITAALQAGLPVILFPEGTSTCGSQVLPFHSALLHPAIQSKTPITAAAIGYQSLSHPEAAFCYYGDVHFLPHLSSILRIPSARMVLRFHSTSSQYPDRKQAAQRLRQLTLNLRKAMPSQSAAPA